MRISRQKIDKQGRFAQSILVRAGLLGSPVPRTVREYRATPHDTNGLELKIMQFLADRPGRISAAASLALAERENLDLFFSLDRRARQFASRPTREHELRRIANSFVANDYDHTSVRELFAANLNAPGGLSLDGGLWVLSRVTIWIAREFESRKASVAE